MQKGRSMPVSDDDEDSGDNADDDGDDNAIDDDVLRGRGLW